uniref:Homing endonuclease n=1 Tax=Vibrio phage P018-4 TaxID=3229728 RepID=A0AB39AJF8_9CAUD
MSINKTQYKFFVERKIPRLGDFENKIQVSVHQVINSKSGYDPFNMKSKGTKRHNELNLLKLSYGNYKRGFTTKNEFLYLIRNKTYLAKYYRRFK